jgi:hypothetical protein
MSVAVDPGLARTELGTKEVSGTQRLVMRVSFLLVPSHSAETGAGPTLRAATDPNAVSGQLYAPRLGILGGPVVQRPSRRTTGDPQVAARLWDASLGMLGLEPPTTLIPADTGQHHADH